MKINRLGTFAIAIALCSTLTANAQVRPMDPLKPLTATTANPVNPLEFCADPTAVEHDGRLYVYTTYDQQEYDARNGEAGNSYSLVSSVLIMSTTDMVNWTNHGTVDLHRVCGNFVPMAWAPSVVKRVEADGLTHFYMYFSIGGGAVGVVTSTSPVGPWTSPLNRPLVDSSTPGATPCCWIFDPGVVIDDNGVGWMAFGGGNPVDDGTTTWTKNPRIARLGNDMVSIDSEIVPIKAPYHFEANELNIIGGKFVYTYCSNWESREDWSTLSLPGYAPSFCSMNYMVSENPLDPDGWTWGGEVVANPGVYGYEWANNHTHMHKYNNKYYLLYHAQSLRKLMGIDKPDYRSLGVSDIAVDEVTAKITATGMGETGAEQIEANRPLAYERQQAEMIWNARNVKPVMEGEAGNTVMQSMGYGSWIAVKNAKFGTTAMKSLTARLKGRGRMEVRIDDIKATPVATVDFCSQDCEDISVPLNKEITGDHNIYFVFDTRYGAAFDEWQFSANEVAAPQPDNTPYKYEHGIPLPSYSYLDEYLPLKQYIDYDKHPNFHLGAALLAPDYIKGGTIATVINTNFTELEAGNEMKMQFVVDNEGNMHFETVKDFVKKATEAGVSVFGHTLAWHSQQNPVWLNGLLNGLTTQEEKHDALVGAMDKWIGGMMAATEGKVKAWDVVNEPIVDWGDEDKDGTMDLRKSGNDYDFFWPLHMGDLEYVRQAVRLAREHYAKANGGDDGKLKLFINDYNLESDWDNNWKLGSLITWIKRWEEDGVTKIDGIGSQMHINCYMNQDEQNRKKNAIRNSFKMMAATGKLVRISELDMGLIDANGKHVTYDCINEEQERYMADFYEWIYKTYFEEVPAEQQWGICCWSLGDQDHFSGWRPGIASGLWDNNWYRKHNYGGVARGLTEADEPEDLPEDGNFAGSEPMDGRSYYFYNVSTGKWLNTGYGVNNAQFGVDDSGYLAGIESYKRDGSSTVEGGFAIKSILETRYWGTVDGVNAPWHNQLYYGWDNSSSYNVWGGKEQFNIVPVDGQEGCYRIINDYFGRHLAAVGNANDPVTDNYDAGSDIWKLVAPLDRFRSRLKGAKAENGKEYYLYNVKSGKWLNTYGGYYNGPGTFSEVASKIVLEDFDGDNSTVGDFAIRTPERSTAEKPVTYYGLDGNIFADQTADKKVCFAFENVGNNAYVIKADKHGIRDRRFAYNEGEYTVVDSYEVGADLWQLIPATTTIAAPETLCSYGNNSFDVDFSEAEGVKAYKVVEGSTSNTLKFVEISKLRAGEGCIIRNVSAKEGDPITVKVSLDATANADNLMKAGNGSTVKNDDEHVNYFLSGIDGEPCLVRMGNEGKLIAEGKAYMQIATTQAQNAAAFRIDFDSEEATAIESVKSASNRKSDARYNVMGQKVGADYKGIVIVNGKKSINKIYK